MSWHTCDVLFSLEPTPDNGGLAMIGIGEWAFYREKDVLPPIMIPPPFVVRF